MAEPRHTYWHKDRHLPHERDPVTREILPGALPLGIYCETQAALHALLRSSADRGIPAAADVRADGVCYALAGMAVHVATPAQAAVLQALSTEEPPPPEPDPDWAAMVAKVDALLAKHYPADPPAPPPSVVHPFRGGNRAHRRAAAARRRRV